MEHNQERLIKFLSDTLRSAPSVAPFSLYKDSQTQWLIDKLIASMSSFSILDYGCGNNRLLNAILSQSHQFQKIDYFATDIVEHCSIDQKLLQSHNHISYHYLPIEQLRTSSLSFDYIVLMNVIHEISIINFAKIIENARRSLKPEGLLLLVDMSLLPEGEPKALPYHPWEIEFIFFKSKNKSFTSKSGIPILAIEIPRSGIPVFSQFLQTVTSLVKEKRDIYSALACALSEPSLPHYYNELLIKLSTNKGPEHDLAYLMLLSGHANWRLIEEQRRVNATYDEIASAATSILKFVDEKWHEGHMEIDYYNVFDKLGDMHRYEALNKALFLMTRPAPGSIFTPTFFFLEGADNNLGERKLIATETLDAFEEYYDYSDIKSLGLRRLQEECHLKKWPAS